MSDNNRWNPSFDRFLGLSDGSEDSGLLAKTGVNPDSLKQLDNQPGTISVNHLGTDLCSVAIEDPDDGLDTDFIQISRKRLAALAPESMLNRMFDPTQQLAVKRHEKAYLLTGSYTTLRPLLEYISCGEEPCFSVKLQETFDFYGIPVPEHWHSRMKLVSSLKENKNAIKNVIRELAEAIISVIPQHIHAYTKNVHPVENLELYVYTPQSPYYETKDVYISSEFLKEVIGSPPFHTFFLPTCNMKTLKHGQLLESELPSAIMTAGKGVIDDVTVDTKDLKLTVKLSFAKSMQ
jgi:hypothetical protein